MLEKTERLKTEIQDLKTWALRVMVDEGGFDSADENTMIAIAKMLRLVNLAMDVAEEQATIMDELNDKIDEVNRKLDELLKR